MHARSDYSKCPGSVQIVETIAGTDATVLVEHACPLRDRCRRYVAPAAERQVWMLPNFVGNACRDHLPT